jgi:hypothetical protein
MQKVLGPVARNFHKTKKGGEMTAEKKAIRILARSLPLADLLQAIDSDAESLEVALVEIVFNLQAALRQSYDEDSGYANEKEWACRLLRNLSRQRQDIDSRGEIFIRFIRGDDYDSYRRCERCILVGLLFPVAKLHDIFGTMAASHEEQMMASICAAWKNLHDLQQMNREQCDTFAEEALAVDPSQLKKTYVITDFVSMLGGVVRSSSNHDLHSRVLEQVLCCAKTNKIPNCYFDYTVVVALKGLIEEQPGSKTDSRWACSMKNAVEICKDFRGKWGESQEPHAASVTDMAQKILDLLDHA